jgi:hypothetical protein
LEISLERIPVFIRIVVKGFLINQDSFTDPIYFWITLAGTALGLN